MDDDKDLVDVLTFVFQRAGFATIPAHDREVALQRLGSVDIVLMDVDLGRDSGFDLLVQMRRRSDVPVIVLSGRRDEEDVVRGLDLGADDYITKPFNHREVIARVRAKLRKVKATAVEQHLSIVKIGPLTLEESAHAVFKDGEPVALSLTELRLLHYLMLRAGSVVPSEALVRQVWHYEDAGLHDVLRLAVHRLRRKLKDDPTNPQLLETVPGLGIKLRTPLVALPPPSFLPDQGAGLAGTCTCVDPRQAMRESEMRRTAM
ncbi:MAG TPA: response regulator transcription factor [Chloroflexota bacterium]